MSYGGPYQPANSYAQSFIGHPTDPNVGLPPGWIARWDQNTQHWYYVDTSTGRSVWERPVMQQMYAPPPQAPPQQPLGPPQTGYYAAGAGAGAGAAASYGASSSGGYDHHFDDKGYHKNWSSHQDTYTESKHSKPSSSPKAPKKDKNWGKYAAVGAGALGLGVVGGAVLAHEGDEIKDWAGNKVDSVEQGFDGFKDNIENAPVNAAGWVGDKVGEVEGKYDDFKDDVENIPENVAGWTGEQVGKVEAFGDDVKQYGNDLGDAYDQGKDDGRYGSGSNSDSGSSSSSSDDGGNDDGGDYDYDDGGDDGGDYDE
ncbi:hypothetical protein TWF281_006703 [Arthrobotrys megalospora]